MRIDCPSGLAFEAREWTLGDMEAMAREAESDLDEEGLAAILRRAWTRTIDAGPYPFIDKMDVGFEWKRILKADIIWALYRLRAGSFPDDEERGTTGDDYDFQVECQAHKVPVEYQWQIKLSDIQVRALPDSSRVTMLSGRPLEAKTTDGRKVNFRLPTLEIDAELIEYRKQKKIKSPPKPSDYFGAQTTFIEGLKSPQDIEKRIKFFSDLPAKQFVPLRDAMSRAGCHVLATVMPTCPECGRKREVRLPLTPAFFMPRDPMSLDPIVEEASEEEDTQAGSAGSA